MKGVILLGGYGSRLRPLTFTSAKQLLPIANKPMAVYAIEILKNSGISDIGLIVGHTDERVTSIKGALGDGSAFGVNFTYIFQDQPRGIAHAVSLAEEFVGNDPFVVYLGDNIMKGGISEYVRIFQSDHYDGGFLFTHHKSPEAFGCAIVEDGRIIGVEEKPKVPKSDLVMTGVYFFRKSVFDIIKTLKPSWRNELEITDAAHVLISSGKYRVMTDLIKDWWKDTGKPEDILEANQLVLDDLVPNNKGLIKNPSQTKILGKVAIGKGTVIHEETIITGPAIIGDNCNIGPNVKINPYTSIGNNCTIKNTEIEFSVIMDGTLINGKKKRIVNSLIGRDVSVLENNGAIDDNRYRFIVGDKSVISL